MLSMLPTRQQEKRDKSGFFERNFNGMLAVLAWVMWCCVARGCGQLLNNPSIDQAPPNVDDLPYILCDTCRQFVANAHKYVRVVPAVAAVLMYEYNQ